MIPRYDTEPQRHYVERVLRAHGEIRTYDVLYSGTYHDGRKFSITRLAAIIHNLRHEHGWDIATSGGTGETAVYRLAYAPPIAEPRKTVRPLAVVPSESRLLDREPVAPINEATLPTWARGWRCTECGGRPAAEPAPMLGDLGRGPCAVCHAARYFRRAA